MATHVGNVFAGQLIRFEPEDKPRFEPTSEAAWNAKFSAGMPDVTPAFPVNGGN
jgi:N-acyl-D-glutamate deacylase